MTKIYLVGSLRNEAIPHIANKLRPLGYEVFDDWFAGGKIADDEWQAYENVRGRSYGEALAGHAAQHIFHFDKGHIDSSDIGVLVMPAGRSGHLELGYMAGQGKRTYILFDQVPERYDVMYNFADEVFFNVEDLIKELDVSATHT